MSISGGDFDLGGADRRPAVVACGPRHDRRAVAGCRVDLGDRRRVWHGDRPDWPDRGRFTVGVGQVDNFDDLFVEDRRRHPEQPAARVELNKGRGRRREPVVDHHPRVVTVLSVLDPVVGDFGILRRRPRQRHPTHRR